MSSLHQIGASRSISICSATRRHHLVQQNGIQMSIYIQRHCYKIPPSTTHHVCKYSELYINANLNKQTKSIKILGKEHSKNNKAAKYALEEFQLRHKFFVSTNDTNLLRECIIKTRNTLSRVHTQNLQTTSTTRIYYAQHVNAFPQSAETLKGIRKVTRKPTTLKQIYNSHITVLQKNYNIVKHRFKKMVKTEIVIILYFIISMSYYFSYF